MQDTLHQQLDISKGLLEALDRMVNSFETMLGRTASQSSITNDISKSMQEAENSMDQAASTSSKMQKDIVFANKIYMLTFVF